ncbi:hypothetical protein JAAARDRAFT_476269 [Jaapia argillacea MUCL 33604]|uniref:PARP catalytic domain-containing protein n=1 Tax=Jaapia argillacea MUCL 33604 TaxID=933084 RepID=A0A067PCY6_9AGAM|nr:hypothetical protein JAAARDRAFT_476269 [Jaapia argillacea MUCL 33604]
MSARTSATSNLCEECHQRPKCHPHPYCGRRCATANANRKAQSNGNPGMCIGCKSKPKFKDGNKIHDYCSRRCAGLNSTTQSSGNIGMCIGCNAFPRRKEGNVTHDYCSRSCALNSRGKRASHGLAIQAPTNIPQTRPDHACLWCKKAEKRIGQFCSLLCDASATRTAPSILEVPADHVTFKSVSGQFKASWRHANKKCPVVKKIYKVIVDSASRDRYFAYRDAVEARGHFASRPGSSLSVGNEHRRWHGTSRACNLGDTGHTTLCNGVCALCSIIRTSYDIALVGGNTGFSRFGKGIYASSTSSKSDDYSKNTGKSSLKAMLLNTVVVGKGHKLYHNDPNLTGPPLSFDSILAETGHDLNHDEVIVYNNDAIRPAYLVMYDA